MKYKLAIVQPNGQSYKIVKIIGEYDSLEEAYIGGDKYLDTLDEATLAIQGTNQLYIFECKAE